MSESLTDLGTSDVGVADFVARGRNAWLQDAVRQGMQQAPTWEAVQASLHGAPAPPPLADGAPAFAEFPGVATPIEAASIDIWMSAGRQDAEGGSCDMDNNENCRLYKVSWNLATHSGAGAVLGRCLRS